MKKRAFGVWVRQPVQDVMTPSDPIAAARAAPAWRRGFERALDLLYPAACSLCGGGLSHGRALCGECADDLPRLSAPFCASCGQAFDGRIDGSFSCPNCAGVAFAFEFARPAIRRDARLLDLVHRVKYGREIHLARELAGLAVLALRDERFAPALAGRWPLVPVPLHRGRLRQRHFNQSAEIARHLSRLTGLPMLHALRRVRATDTQTRLGRKLRMENLRGAFATSRRGRAWIAAEAPGAILVDDVLTTGSTLHECAKVLHQAGVGRVQALAVMRG